MKFFKCGKCDKILEKKYAGNHPKSAITWYNADEEDERKKKVDELQENSNEEDKEKKVNDIDTLKAKLHQLEERMKDVDDDELNDLLESVRAQLEELEKPKKEIQEAQRKKYDVLAYEQYNSVSYSGDDLMQARGSRD